MTPFKFVRKNTAWHLTSAAVRVQYKQQNQELAELKQESLCSLKVTASK